MRLSIGLYIDYGLIALKGKSDSMPLVTYSPAGVNAVKANSLLNMPDAGPAKLLAFGLQLRLSLGQPSVKHAAKPTQQPVVQPEITKVSPVAATTAIKSPTPNTTRMTSPSPDTTTMTSPSPDTTAMTPPSPDTTAAIPSYYDSLGINYDDALFIEQPVIFGLVDEVAIPQVGKVHLDKVAVILMQHPKIRISLVGHICNSETETEDPKVGSVRVKAVASYLMSKGIRRKRMDVSALKESDPVQPNNPPANYRRRRVAITVE
jgi:outer membrane protein OmpA-like peptidoglycan-associated protein